MKVAIEINGLDSIVKDFATAEPAVKRELNTAINFAGVRIQREARMEAPVRTGNLRSQIRFKNTNNGQGVVGSYAKYSIYVHEGTKYQSSNPFMERAIQNSKPDLDIIFSTAVRNIGKHLAKGK
jgi:HK97 gp10 family phage protein